MKRSKRELIAAAIKLEIGHTNGWGVPDKRYDELCDNAAREILKLVRAPRRAPKEGHSAARKSD